MADSFRSTATSLIKYDENLWTYEGSLTVAYGIFRLPSRMTIIRLPETNHLVIISPFPPTDMIKNLLAQIGKFSSSILNCHGFVIVNQYMNIGIRFQFSKFSKDDQ